MKFATRKKTKNRVLAGIMAFAFLLAGVSWSQTDEEQLTDAEITNAVDDELTLDGPTPAMKIDVSTDEGIVTLTGEVNSILGKDRAEDIAATVKGVRGIINRISVVAAQRPDLEIQEDIEDALLADPATESWEIVASVNDSVVTLTGNVDSYQEKQLAAKVAKGVRGVVEVNNNVTIDYDTERPDVDIEKEIQQILRWDPYVDDALITVSVDNGVVTLAGTVGSLAEKTRATNKAWVPAVTSVDASELEVRLWARDEELRKDKYVSKTDKQVEDAVQDAFLYDPRVNMFDIDVDASNGYVTLRGKVDNLQARRAAGTDARNVLGVWGVKNQLKVRPAAPPSDSRIDDNVADALQRDPFVDRYEITVSVADGHVYLHGDVDSTYEKTHAEDVASRQAGVTAVHNFLSVNIPEIAGYNPYTDESYPGDYDWYAPEETTPKATDWEIKQAIQDQIYWSPYVESEDVTVTVDNGVAELTGTVDTWAERQAAEENAWDGGAIDVNNKLSVEYAPEYYQP